MCETCVIFIGNDETNLFVVAIMVILLYYFYFIFIVFGEGRYIALLVRKYEENSV